MQIKRDGIITVDTGPKVAMEIERLNERTREVNTAHARGEITLKALSVVLQRVEIHRQMTICHALAAALGDEVPALVTEFEIQKPFRPFY
ncbi:MAG TPA: hypothetical protein VI260_22900 [Blastocatellia bacterium]|jgi:hypothetical protein